MLDLKVTVQNRSRRLRTSSSIINTVGDYVAAIFGDVVRVVQLLLGERYVHHLKPGIGTFDGITTQLCCVLLSEVSYHVVEKR